MLLPKARLRRVLNGEEVDRPPCICPGGMMNMVTKELIEKVGSGFPKAHMDSVMMADLAAEVYETGCFENYGVPFCMTIEAEGFGAKIDMGTGISEPHVVEYIINSVKEWREIPRFSHRQGRGRVVLDAIKLLKERNSNVPIIGNLTGPMSTASSIIEPVVFYKELRKANKEAHELMTFITDQLISFAEGQIEAGADMIAISDPSGTGEILGPKLFDEFTVAYINKIIDSVKKAGIPTIVHICGQMKNVYTQLNKLKSDVISFDSIVNMKEARENLPDRLLMGNVSTYAIEFGDPRKIAELTKKCAKDGANIVSPACGLGMKSPLKNVMSMLEALEKEL
ncbi:methylcobamide:CoM methyltransferase MtbA [Proteiniborus sp. MB09-C3]|uniref:methylcobamide:CoM methyltransferase MtbA n=1 Tax=Proteiniborus sp. MB09-C3 TaxID=3050072 RepID=UPI0025538121|nr:methylcobamide:CoM methyltransferase MtbA [Proteiniborus sp. MB09-C3]WIV12943.1 uroporphyrinogen decarboxylase family protein [Proteiniborus sp. MB09-C3]